MNEHHVSPDHPIDALTNATVETKIDIFERQTSGWILDHADALASEQYAFREHGGFAILMLVSSYFEAIEAIYQGKTSKSHSKDFFREGFKKVFPEIATRFNYLPNPDEMVKSVIDDVYNQLRCGLYHDGAARGRIILRHDTGAIGFVHEPAHPYEIVTIVIDPWQVLARVKTHFAQFLGELRDPNQSTLRSTFENIFDSRAALRTQVIPYVTFPLRSTSTF